jgi:hypothetical protein
MRQLCPPTLNVPDEMAVPMPAVALYREYPWTLNSCHPVDASTAQTMDVLPPAVAAEEDDM